jgi:hypothetical protein
MLLPYFSALPFHLLTIVAVYYGIPHSCIGGKLNFLWQTAGIM